MYNLTTYYVRYLLVALLVSTVVYVQYLLPSYSIFWAILPVALVSSLSVVILLRDPTISIPKTVAIPLLIIYISYILHTWSDPLYIPRFGRTYIFIFVSFTCVFVIPTGIELDKFLKTISITATIIAAIGIPAAFIGPYAPLITTHNSTSVFGLNFSIIESIYINPNELGEMLLFGTVASIVWNNKRISRVAVSICGIGLFFTQSRAALLATASAILVYILGSNLKREQFITVITFCSLAGSAGYLMLMRLVPSLTFIDNIDLSGRRLIWSAALDAVVAKPIIGHGHGDVRMIVSQYTTYPVGGGVYNSFLRLFVTTGIVGGLCYLFIFIYLSLQQMKVVTDKPQLIVYSIFIGFIVNELFSGNSIFGLSTTSVVGSLLVGYITLNVSKSNTD